MKNNFTVDYDPRWNAAVLYWNLQERRSEFALIDAATQKGSLMFALLTVRWCLWKWTPIDWTIGPLQ